LPRPKSKPNTRTANPKRVLHGRFGHTISHPALFAKAASRGEGFTTVAASQSASIGKSAQLSV
jgi:hypothetical protein